VLLALVPALCWKWLLLLRRRRRARLLWRRKVIVEGVHVEIFVHVCLLNHRGEHALH
jgi:hypothetical protein